MGSAAPASLTGADADVGYAQTSLAQAGPPGSPTQLAGPFTASLPHPLLTHRGLSAHRASSYLSGSTLLRAHDITEGGRLSSPAHQRVSKKGRVG